MGRYAAIAETRRRPAVVSIERHLIVGQRMEYQVALEQVITDLGASLQFLAFADVAPADYPQIADAQRLVRLGRQGLANVLAMVKAESGVLDGLCDDEDGNALGHGRAA